MNKPDLKWYNFFSWWVFIWFILYKLNVIPYNPFFVYVIIYIYLLYRCIIFIINKEYKNKGNLFVSFFIGLILLVVDLLPIFFVKHEIKLESVMFSLLLGLIYILVMSVRNINILDFYNNVSYKNIMLN